MNAVSVPVNYSADLDAESPGCLGIEGHPTLSKRAIQSLEAHPDFRWSLVDWGIQIESNGDKLILKGRVPS